MGQYSCKVCDDKVACRKVNELLAEGMTAEAVARYMSMGGVFPVTAPTIRQHRPHQVLVAPVGKRQRDIAILTQEKVADLIESPGTDILDKNVQGAIKTGLSAQKLLDTRASKSDDRKLAFIVATAIAGGGLAGFIAPPELQDEDDGEEGDDVIEGEATVVE